MIEEQNTIKKRYEKYAFDREAHLRRARKCAELTIPMLLPPEGSGPHTDYLTPYQGLGARGVNNLASKLLLALLPPNSPFFRLNIDEATINQVEAMNKTARTEIEASLAQIERKTMREVESSSLRVNCHEVFKHLIVSGNALAYLGEDAKSLRVYRLDRYVVKRDPDGRVLEIITKEMVSPLALDEDIIEACGVDVTEDPTQDQSVELYTQVKRTKSNWEITQEINGKAVPESDGTYPLEKSPWLALRWTAVDNEDYGRGHVEEYMGDLISLEGLSQAIIEMSAAAAKVVFLVEPGTTTSPAELARTKNCGFVRGSAQDVGVLQVEKYNDLKVAFETIQIINERLAHAFLLNSAVQRNAERVTAEEIRYMAQELETSIGGVYTTLSQEFQLPLVKLLLDRLTAAKKIPPLPKNIVTPSIITGLEALGRGNDLQRMSVALQTLQAAFGPEIIAQYIKVDNAITRIMTSVGVDAEGLVKTQEEIQAEQQQAMMSQTMAGMAPQMMDAALQQQQGGQQ